MRGRWVQHNEHEGPNVVNPDVMSVEGGDGVGVEPEAWGALGAIEGGTTVTEEALHGGHLGGQDDA